MWHINAEPPSDRDTSFGAQDDDRWWDQVDLGKLILADNQIKEIAEDIRLLTGLAILDVKKWQIIIIRAAYIMQPLESFP